MSHKFEVYIIESAEDTLRLSEELLEALKGYFNIHIFSESDLPKAVNSKEASLLIIDSKIINDKNLNLINDCNLKNVLITFSINSYPKNLAPNFLDHINLKQESRESFSNKAVYIFEILALRKQLFDLAQREEANMKMATLGEMTATLAHEINNPLTIILGQISLLNRYSPLNDNQKFIDGLQKIEKTVMRITNIIKSLRFYSRDDSGDPPESVRLQDIIEEVIVISHEKFYASGIDLQLEINENFSVVCREVQISQIILNLLQNSFDAIKDTQNPWVSITAKKKDDYISLTVSDSGRNISQKISDSIFNPFFTTKEKGRGTGLGLSLSKRIAQEHGGDLIHVAEAPTTTFELKLKLN